jgi:hypothetical protein
MENLILSEKALNEYKKAIALDPKGAAACFNRGTLYRQVCKRRPLFEYH